MSLFQSMFNKNELSQTTLLPPPPNRICGQQCIDSQYSCTPLEASSSKYYLHILDSRNRIHADLFRTHVRNQLGKSFKGWDDRFDSKFDQHSTLTVATNVAGEILATCKIVYRYIKGIAYNTPMSYANNNGFVINDDPVKYPLAGEGTSTTSIDPYALGDLICAVGLFCAENQIGPLYVLGKAHEPRTLRLYQKWGYCEIEAPPIQFNSIQDYTTQEIIKWSILRQSPEQFAYSAVRLSRILRRETIPHFVRKDFERESKWLKEIKKY